MNEAGKAGDKRLSTVPLDWSEVYYTNCPLVSASNVDQELGWTKEEFKKIGVNYQYLRARKENNWYPHYIHNLDNLIRFGGLYPPSMFTPTSAAPGCWARRGCTKAAAWRYAPVTRSSG